MEPEPKHEYLRKADDCRKFAEHSTDSVLRTTWLRLAEACAKLANRAATVKAQKS